jgi:phosphoglycolate phosphatase
MQKLRQAVLFDLDGPLLDSLGDLAESMNAVLREDGLPTHGLDDFRFFIGDGIQALVKRSLPLRLHNDRPALEAYLDRYRASYSQRWHLSKPFAGIADLLDTLQAQGVGLGIVSNKPDNFTQQCVQTLFPAWTWEGVVGQLDHVPSKPDPTGALAMAEKLGVQPEDCWFVGDSDVDMKTGVNAGMNVVGVSWGFRPERELRDAGAQHIIGQPAELLALLNKD